MNNSIDLKLIERALAVPRLVNFTPDNPINLSSGILSPIYFDWRQSSLDQNLVDLIIDELFQVFRQRSCDHVVGIATGGLRYASIFANKMRLPESYVRTKADLKYHGATRDEVDGPDVMGKNVILIDDVLTTGGSALRAIITLGKSGVASVSYCSIFSYLNPKNIDFLLPPGILMSHKFSVLSLMTLEDFIPAITTSFPDGNEKAKLCSEFLAKLRSLRNQGFRNDNIKLSR